MVYNLEKDSPQPLEIVKEAGVFKAVESESSGRDTR